jgi:hypothetical protein
MSYHDYTNLTEIIPADDYQRSADQLDEHYNPEGGGEHPVFSRADWRDAVANEDTLSGYWEWVEHMLNLVTEGDLV